MKKINLLFLLSIFSIFSSFAVITIDTHVTYSSDQLITEDIIITPTGKLTVDHCTLHFDKDIMIYINNHGELECNFATLTAFNPNFLWRGIYMEQTEISTNFNPAITAFKTTISYAVHGLRAAPQFSTISPSKARKLDFNTCTFSHNNNHMVLQYELTNLTSINNELKFVNVIFEGELQQHGSQFLYVRNLLIDKCLFKSSSAGYPGYAPHNQVPSEIIIGMSNNYVVSDSRFMHTMKFGIIIINDTQNGEIRNNDFFVPSDMGPDANVLNIVGHNYTGILTHHDSGHQQIQFDYLENLIVEDNNFLELDPESTGSLILGGVHIETGNANDIHINNNTFEQFNQPISVFKINGADPSFISSNTFEYYDAAIQFSGGNPSLDVSCNKFLQGSEGMVIQDSYLKNHDAYDHTNDFVACNPCIVNNQFMGLFKYGIYTISGAPVGPSTAGIGGIGFVSNSSGILDCGGSGGSGNPTRLVQTKENINITSDNNNITISELGSDANIHLSDALGRTVFSTNNVDTELNIDISNYISGVYYLSISTINEKISEKIVKQ